MPCHLNYHRVMEVSAVLAHTARFTYPVIAHMCFHLTPVHPCTPLLLYLLHSHHPIMSHACMFLQGAVSWEFNPMRLAPMVVVTTQLEMRLLRCKVMTF